jgi:hypothetical protein
MHMSTQLHNPLNLQGKSSGYPLEKNLRGPYSHSESGDEENNICLARIQTLVSQSYH